MSATTSENPQKTREREAQLPNGSSSQSLSVSGETTVEAPQFTISTRFLLAFASLAVLTLMVALDGTSLSVALPIIARKLHGTAIEAFWAGTSFLLCSTVFQPHYAAFSHIFGRTPLIMVAVTLFFIGVMLAALADNFTLLLVGRSIQGVGGGGKFYAQRVTRDPIDLLTRNPSLNRDHHHGSGPPALERSVAGDYCSNVVHRIGFGSRYWRSLRPGPVEMDLLD